MAREQRPTRRQIYRGQDDVTLENPPSIAAEDTPSALPLQVLHRKSWGARQHSLADVRAKADDDLHVSCT